jgi:hypothetical protein
MASGGVLPLQEYEYHEKIQWINLLPPFVALPLEKCVGLVKQWAEKLERDLMS